MTNERQVYIQRVENGFVLVYEPEEKGEGEPSRSAAGREKDNRTRHVFSTLAEVTAFLEKVYG